MSKKNLVIFCLALTYVELLAWPATGKAEEVNKSTTAPISKGWVESAKKALPIIAATHGKAIRSASKEFNIPAEVVIAVATTEVAGNEKNPVITSRANAVGPMQVTEIAQDQVENEFGFKCNLKKPDCNFRTGTAYLRSVCDDLPGCKNVKEHLSYVAVGYVDGTSAAKSRMRARKGTDGHQYVQKVKSVLRMARQELALQ